jgi:hypothetical protein
VTDIELTSTNLFALRVGEAFIEHLRQEDPKLRLTGPMVNLTRMMGDSRPTTNVTLKYKFGGVGWVNLDMTIPAREEQPWQCTFFAEAAMVRAPKRRNWTAIAVEMADGRIQLAVNPLDQLAAV